MDPDVRRRARAHRRLNQEKEHVMNNIIWIVGAVVIVMFILGVLGLT